MSLLHFETVQCPAREGLICALHQPLLELPQGTHKIPQAGQPSRNPSVRRAERNTDLPWPTSENLGTSSSWRISDTTPTQQGSSFTAYQSSRASEVAFLPSCSRFWGCQLLDRHRSQTWSGPSPCHRTSRWVLSGWRAPSRTQSSVEWSHTLQPQPLPHRSQGSVCEFEALVSFLLGFLRKISPSPTWTLATPLSLLWPVFTVDLGPSTLFTYQIRNKPCNRAQSQVCTCRGRSSLLFLLLIVSDRLGGRLRKW